MSKIGKARAVQKVKHFGQERIREWKPKNSCNASDRPIFTNRTHEAASRHTSFHID